MACGVFEELIDKYVEGLINLDEKKFLDKHIEKCAYCGNEMKVIDEIVKTLNGIEQIDLPRDYMSTLHKKLVQVHGEQHKQRGFEASISGFLKNAPVKLSNFYKRYKKRITVGAAVIVIGLFGFKILTEAGFGNMAVKKSDEIAAEQALEERDRGYTGFGQNEDKSIPEVKLKSVENLSQSESISGSLDNSNVSQRKIIKSASITVYVEDFDRKLASLMGLAQKYGGYVENSSVSSHKTRELIREAYISIRIPEASLISALEEIKSFGNCDSENITGEEITESYFNTDARARNLERQEERLLAILNMAENVDEVLRIENELNRVRTEQDQLIGQLRAWDKMIELSSINISLIEQQPSKEKLVKVSLNALLGKVREGFITALNELINALSLFAHLIGIILPIAVIIGFLYQILLVLIKWIKKRKYK
jgi:hypothetical protein